MKSMPIYCSRKKVLKEIAINIFQKQTNKKCGLCDRGAKFSLTKIMPHKNLKILMKVTFQFVSGKDYIALFSIKLSHILK